MSWHYYCYPHVTHFLAFHRMLAWHHIHVYIHTYIDFLVINLVIVLVLVKLSRCRDSVLSDY